MSTAMRNEVASCEERRHTRRCKRKRKRSEFRAFKFQYFHPL